GRRNVSARRRQTRRRCGAVGPAAAPGLQRARHPRMEGTRPTRACPESVAPETVRDGPDGRVLAGCCGLLLASSALDLRLEILRERDGAALRRATGGLTPDGGARGRRGEIVIDRGART